MNVFYTDPDPVAAARSLPDQHVVKMQLEAAQLLCTAAHLRGLDGDGLYKPTHGHHPCTQLVHADQRTAAWVLAHGLALVAEWRWRTGDPSKCQKVEAMLHRVAQRLGLDAADAPQGAPMALAVPGQWRQLPAVRAYRATVQDKLRSWHEAGRPARYTRRPPPSWMAPDVVALAVLR